MSFVAKVIGSQSITNKAEISKSDQFDPDSQINTGTEDGQDDTDDAILTPKIADLSVEKLVSKTNPNVGETITYTIKVKNAGPDNATNVQIKDVLPVGLQFVSSTDFSLSSNILLSNNIASITSGGEATLTFQAKVTQSGAILNKAEVSKSDVYDIDSQPNTGTEDGQDDTGGITIGGQQADLSLQKDVDTLTGMPATPNVGDIVTYSITVLNAGPSVGTGVEVKDILPAGLQFVSSTDFINRNDTLITSAPLTLGIGTPRVLTFKAKVLTPIGANYTIINKAEITKADQVDSDSQPNTGTEDGQDDTDNAILTIQRADLRLQKTVSKINPTVGESVTYTILVTNEGPNAATNVEVKDVLPTGLEFVSTGTPGGSTLTNNNGTLTGTIINIPVGVTRSVTFVAKVTQSGAILNKAEVSKSDQFDPDSQPNTGTEDGQDDTGGVIIGGQQADLSLTKTVDNPRPNVGDNVTYTISVSNHGPSDATHVEVRDVLPAGLQFVSSSDFTSQGSILLTEISTLINGSTKVLKFVAKVIGYQKIVNKAEISKADQFDPNSQPNTGTEDGQNDTDSTVVKPQVADLSLTKTASNQQPNVGDEITYTITVKNAGTDPATNVQVRDILPTGLTFVSSVGTPNADFTLSGSNILTSKNILSIAVNGQAVLTFVARVSQPLSITNKAQIIKSDQFDSDSQPNNGTDNNEDDTDGVTIGGQQADLSLKKDIDKVNPNVGDVVTYSITVNNAGPSIATGVEVKDILPAGLQFVSSTGTPAADFIANGDTLKAQIGTIQIGTPRVVTFKAKVLAPINNQTTIINAAEISKADQQDPDSQVNTGTTDGQDDTDDAILTIQMADLKLLKTVSNPSPIVGSTVTYSITVTNEGSSAATNVEITDVLPTGLQFVSSLNFVESPSGILKTTIANLASGTNRTITFDAKVTQAGAILNKAEITKSDQFDPDSQPNTGTEDGQDDNGGVTIGGQQADLSLKKLVSNVSPNVGENVTYTIEVTNSGPSTATNIEVKDILPTSLQFVSSSDFIQQGNILTAQIPNIANGEKKSVTFVAKTTNLPLTNSQIINRAEISKADQFDPDSNPNSGTSDGEDDTDSVSVKSRSADLSLKKSVSNTNPQVSDVITYTIKIKNNGLDNATNVQAKDILPDGLTFISTTDFSLSSTNILTSNNIASIAVGQEISLTFQAKVMKAGTILNKAEITKSDQADPNSTPNNGTENNENDTDGVLINAQQADLSLEKLVSNLKPNVGEVITYTVKVFNAGPNKATNVQVKDILPTGLDFVASADFTNSNDSLTSKNVDSIAVGNSSIWTFQAKVVQAGAIENRAEVLKSDQYDADSQPNTGTKDGQDDQNGVTIQTQQADLSLQKTVSAGTYNVGDIVTYSITVNNAGTDLATNIEVTDILPTGLSFVGSTSFINTAGTLKANITGLAIGTSVILNYQAKITQSGTINNKAQITKADQFDPDSSPNNGTANGEDDTDNEVISTQPAADLSLTKVVSNRLPNVNEQITYTITVKNAGPDTARNVQVKDVLPSGLLFISTTGTPAADFTLSLTTLTSNNIPKIAPNDSVKLTFVAQVSQPMSVVNKAEISKSDTFDPDSQPNTGTEDGQDDTGGVIISGQQADLSLEKSVSNAAGTLAEPNVGETVTYTITVRNAGPDVATGVQVKDILPAGLSLVSTSDFSLSGDTLTNLTPLTIQVGTPRVLTFVAQVSQPVTIINKAEISKVDQFDPDSQPNTGVNDGQDDTDDAVIKPQIADLSLKKSVDNASVINANGIAVFNVGDILTYRLKVTNAGPSTATNVDVKDILPAGLTFISSNDVVNNAGILTGTVQNLPVGSTRELVYIAQISQSVNTTNKAEITKSDQFDLDSSPNNGTQNGEDDTDSTSVYGRSADLSIQKIASDSVFNVGDVITYSIKVKNNGTDTQTNVTVKDILPTGLTFVSTGTPGSSDFVNQGNTLTSQVQNLLVGETKTLTYNAKISAFSNTLKNVVQLINPQIPDLVTTNDKDSATVRIRQADLSLTKTVSNPTGTPAAGTPADPNINDVVTFTLTVKNDGGDIATNVQVKDILPIGLEFVSSTDFSLFAGNILLSKTLPIVIKGTPEVLTFKARITQAGKITNKAEIIKSDTYDADSQPNTGTEDGQDDVGSVTISGQQADLSLDKLVSNIRPNVGDAITYTLRVFNAGPSKATNVQVKDILPSGLTFISSTDFVKTGDTLIANIDSVSVNQIKDLTFVAQVSQPASIINKAQITKSDQFDPDSKPNSGTQDGQDDTDKITIIPQTADLSLRKTVDKSVVNLGDNVIYSITVSNAGPDLATNVQVKDVLPSGIIFVSSKGTPVEDFKLNADTLLWKIPTIAVGGSQTISFIAKLTEAGEKINKAQITKSDQFDSDSKPNNGTENTEDDTDNVGVVVNQIDLSLKKTVSKLKPNVGEHITYTISVKNAGASVATNVEVKDYLPTGLSFVSTGTPAGTDFIQQGTILTAKTDTIKANETKLFTFIAKVLSTADTRQPITNKAEITKADQFDTDSKPNNGTENGEDDQDRVTISLQVADLSLSKIVSNPLASVGDAVTFTLTVTNIGSDTATNVRVKDILPSGLELVSPIDFVDNSGALISKNIPVIVPNGTAKLSFVARVTKAGAIINKAEIISSDQFDPDSQPNTGTDDGQDDIGRAMLNGQQADLSLQKQISNTSPNLGDIVTYTIKVSNAGPNNATNIEVKDVLPVGLQFVSSTATSVGGFSLSGNILTGNIDTVKVGQTVSLTFQAKNNFSISNSQLTNNAEISKADQFDPDSSPNNGTSNGEDDTDGISFTTQAADLSIKKSVSAGPYHVGDNISYTIVVKNNGPSLATNIVVIDSLPNSLAFVSGVDFLNLEGKITAGIGSLAVGTSQTLTVVAKIIKSGNIQNTGIIIKADQTDPDTKNNRDSVSINTQKAADLSLRKLVSNHTPSIGSNVTFTIYVKNSGPDTAQNVQVKDFMPTGLEFISSTGTPTADFTLSNDGNLLSKTIPTLANGDSLALNFVAKVTNLQIINKAEIFKSETYDPDSQPNTGTSDGQDDTGGVVLNGQQADLSIRKDVDNIYPNVGDVVTYTIRVTNGGPSIATNVEVQDILPSGLEIISVGDFQNAGNILTSTFPTIGVNEMKTLIFSAKVLAPTNSTSIQNKVQITKSDQYDPDSQPNSGTSDGQDDTDDAVVNIQQADLSLRKTIDGAVSVTKGSLVTYRLTVSNAGPSTATNVEVKDVLPQGLELVNPADFTNTNGTLTATIPSLLGGTSRTLSFVARITQAGNVLNVAEISKSDQFDPDSKVGNGTNNTEDDRSEVSTFGRSADLSLTKTVSDSVVTSLQTVTYSILVRNAGPDAVGEFTVKDYLPTGVEFVSSKYFTNSAGTLSATVFNVKKDSTVKLTVTARVKKTVLENVASNSLLPVYFVNRAEITDSDTPDPDSQPNNGTGNEEDDTDHADIRVRVADLSLRKLVSNPTPQIGQLFEYKLVVKNEGPDFATNVQVRDILPTGLEFISSNDFTNNNGVLLSKNIVKIDNGKADTLKFITKITNTPLSSLQITNRAEISKSDQLDPDSEPNNGLQNGEDDEASVIVGGQSADLSLTKDVDNPTPNVGDVITYTIKVKNTGLSAATNVQVQDYLPRGLQFMTASVGDWTMTNDSTLVSKIIPQILPNTTITLTVKNKVTALAMARGSSVKNFAEIIKSDQYDPDSQPNTGYGDGQDDTDDGEIKIQYADLSLTKTSSNRKPKVGEEIDYTITVTNDGVSDATNVQVQDILPKGLLYLSGNNWVKIGDTLRNIIPLVNAGMSRSVSFTVKVLVSDAILNKAEISKADQFDPDSEHGNGTTKGEDDEAGVLVNGEQADLSLLKTVSNARPNVGDTITYSISVHNAGPDAATNVEVKDKLPKEIEFIQSDDFDNLGSTLFGTINKIGADSTKILTFKGLVTGAVAFTNRAEISKSDQYDPDSQPNTGIKDGQDDTGAVTVKPRVADLSLQKLADRKTTNIGTSVTFKLVVKNAGPDSATHVVVKDVLPTGLEFVSSKHFIMSNDIVLTSKAITVAPNTTDTLSFVARVVKEGIILNKAEIVKSDVYDPNSKPNSGTEDGEDDNARVSVGGEQADLSLVKTVADQFVNVGKTTTFTIKINNAGPSVATNVQVKDYLPKGLVFVSTGTPASPDFLKVTDSVYVSRNIAQIAVNQTVSLTMVAMVTKDFYNSQLTNSQLVNRAEISKSDQFDPDSQPNTGTEDSQDDQSRATITVPTSDLSLKKTVSNATATIGSEVTYTITVTNDGNDNATNVEVKDYLPKGLTIVKLNDFTISKTSDTLTLKIGRLNAGDSKIYTYTAKILAGGSMINKAEITKTDQFDPDSEHGNGTGKGEDDEASATIGGESADLEIKKTVSNRKPNVGENVTYTITVKNNGSNTATNVEFKDVLPAGLNFVSGDKGIQFIPSTITGKIDSIRTGKVLSFSYIVKLITNNQSPVTNHVEITKSDQFDPNLKNNKDSVSIGGQSADLSLIKLVNKPNANLGEQVTYKLIVKNAGADTATNVVVRDVLPASLGFVASTDFTMTGSALISRKILKIAPNKADTLIFIAKVKDKGMIMNCAEIFKADQFDPDSQVGNGTDNGEDDEACAMLNGDQADLSLIKGVDGYATTPNVGDTITYVLEVRNAGPGIATHVQVSDILPKGIQFISSTGTPAADFSLSGNTLVSKTIDSIKVGSSVKLKFKVKIMSVGGDEVANTIINRAEITKSDQFDPDSQPNTGIADGQDDAGYFAIMPQIADLSLKKNVSNRSPLKGQTVTYTLTVYNAGSAMATNVEVKDVLPAGLTFVSSTDFTLLNGTTYLAKIPAIAAGTSQTVEFVARISKSESIINKAEISKADQFDPDSPHGNGTDKGEDDEASVMINGKQADLSLRKTVDNLTGTPAEPNLGDELVYTLTVRNAGPDEATNVQVQDYLPAGLEFKESFDFVKQKGVLRNLLPIPVIAPDDSVQLTFVGVVTRFAQSCTLTNKAEIWKAAEFDPDSKVGNGIAKIEDDMDSVSVCIQSADLSLKKKVDKYDVKAGETVNYTIIVKNAGPLTATNVKVQDILPIGLKFVSSNDDIVNNKGKLTLSADSIKAGSSATWTFIVDVQRISKSVTNHAQIIEVDQFDPDSTPDNGTDNDEDDEASVTINAGTSDLSIRKDVKPWNANVGQNVTYTITVSNSGTNTATNVHVRDILPEGLKFISSNDFEYNETSRALIGKLDSVEVDKKEKLTFIAKILPKVDSQKPIANKVEIIKSDQFDPDSCPNSGTDDGEDDTDYVVINDKGSDLSLEKFVSNDTGTPAEPNVGGEVTFTLRVHNAGPGVARNTIVKDYLPAELALSEKIDFYNPSEGVLSKTIPMIQPNTYVDLTFKAKVLKGGLITNKAEIFDTRQYDPDSQPNTGTEDGQDDVGVVTLIGHQADLSLNKIVNHTDVTIGDTLLYMVQVDNAGPSEATNVEISDILPDGLQLLESNNGTLNGNVITFKVPSIEKKGFAVFGYKVLVTKEGNLINKAQVTKSDQPDPDSTPNNGKFDGTEDDEASCVVRAKLPCDKTAPTIIASETMISCTDTTILTALGCVGTVNWSDGQKGQSIKISPKTDVSYTAICVLSSTCVSDASKAVKITVTTPDSPLIVSNKQQICGGDSVTLSALTCNGTVVWSNGKTGNSITEQPTITTAYSAICQSGNCKSFRSNEFTVKVGISTPVVTCGRERLCVGESEVLTAHGCEGGKVTWSDGQIGKAILVKPTKTAYQFTAVCELNMCKSEPSTAAYFIVTDCGKDSLKVVSKPMLALCKEARIPVLVEGKTYNITYDFRLVNVGNADFEQIQVLDNLEDVFTNNGAKILAVNGLKADSGLVVNPNYDGQTNNRLLVETQSRLLTGKVKSLQFTVSVDFTNAKVDTFYNSANAVAKAGKVVVQDLSNNGFDVNPDGNNDPTDDSKPTPIRVLSIQKPVDEPKEIFIPEGFSPNGDGINDLFVIDLNDKTLTINLQIYNRWGGLVYAQEDYQNNWDGTANQGANLTGKTGLPDGTYFYMVKLSNGKEFIRSMTLMR
ncbi:gliding motility-associated C-terminal domain-containing protein [Arcicella sp. LKC2W]|uniref:DUF7507 domain-containing protein n=1 Tax=Arcicella sp. LKC2W TaxID=2984198 RepID=UPI002B2153DE|nr:gliding motility-associated C-terminal domain-containing protein [Arcicella sp. LKC2W]MEA5461378.1 gliding motility-associated C-terminal domain-containing protein [Arcicella sp. LKC2W]